MSKALIFSDLHLHAHKARIDRLHDCLEALDWVFESANNHGCEYVFFLGDLFHEQAKIDVLNYLRTFEVFMKHADSDLDIFLLVGNHDMYHRERWDVNSVKPLSALPRVSIVQNPTRLHLGGRKIDWLPHVDNPVQALMDLKKDGTGDLLLAHLAVHGAFTNVFYGIKSDMIVEYDNEMIPVDPSLFNDWQMTFLGHYHGAQKLSEKAEYVGSPLQLSFGEVFQEKHIIVLDLETLTKTYIKNDFSPKHLIITPQDLEHENYDLNRSFVRIEVEDMSRKDLLEIQRTVWQSYKPLSVDTKPKDGKREANESVVEEAKSILNSGDDMMERYIQDKGIPKGLTKERLLAGGRKCTANTTSL